MGDSETVVAEASAAETYATAAGSGGYADSVSNPNQEAVPTAAESAGEAAQANSNYVFGYSNAGEGNAYSGDPNSMLQQAQFHATDDSKQGVGVTGANEVSSGLGNAAMESTQVPDYNSSVNGGAVAAVANAMGLENGNALENTVGSADEKQLADGYGMIFSVTYMQTYPIYDVAYSFVFSLLAAAMSAEEDRLWNIVRANSLDFTAWTALIEETEKVAEVC